MNKEARSMQSIGTSLAETSYRSNEICTGIEDDGKLFTKIFIAIKLLATKLNFLVRVIELDETK
jgi:hypothetical protein